VPVRFVLVYQDQRVPLPEGTVVIGRSMSCQVRFNAPRVSRQHVALRVGGDQVIASNLSATTGTLRNGRPLGEPTPLAPGDRLTLGPREVTLDRASAADLRAATPARPALGLLAEGGEDDEDTLFGDEALAAALAFHTCPSCRAHVPFEHRLCPSCGHLWGDDQPSTRLGQVTSPDVADDLAIAGQVMAVYASEAMTIDVTVTDLGPEGVFVPTELLDAPGTECELTLLPDGQPPLVLPGRVVATRTVADAAGAAGLEVRFAELSAGTRLWIDLYARARRRETGR
jgi:hypothetical protein